MKNIVSILIIGLFAAGCASSSYTVRDTRDTSWVGVLVPAVNSYSRDQVLQGKPLPRTVTLQDLVSGGYIPPDKLQAFDGMDVTVYPTVSDATPKAVLARMRMSDGSQTLVLEDGSIEQLAKR